VSYCFLCGLHLNSVRASRSDHSAHFRTSHTNHSCLRLSGGFLMGSVGVLYLLFEKSILSPTASRSQSSTTLDSLSRTILGIQVGLIVLAMVVTRSSVASIQAKQGLPLGNQVMGWMVLSMEIHSTNSHLLIALFQSHRLLCRSSTVFDQITTTFTASPSSSSPSPHSSSSSPSHTKVSSTSPSAPPL